MQKCIPFALAEEVSKAAVRIGVLLHQFGRIQVVRSLSSCSRLRYLFVAVVVDSLRSRCRRR